MKFLKEVVIMLQILLYILFVNGVLGYYFFRKALKNLKNEYKSQELKFQYSIFARLHLKYLTKEGQKYYKLSIICSIIQVVLFIPIIYLWLFR